MSTQAHQLPELQQDDHQPSPQPATDAFQDLLGLNQDPASDLQNTFYQRQLPTSLIRFSSDHGKRLFREAMEAGHAEGFFPLTGNFTTQSEPAYCGPSSLAMVLNALEVDPKRRWKGNWRWYSGNNVVAKRAPNFSLDEFQNDVADVTARSDKFLVISFSRKTLGQTGDGHFSPIGAYNPDTKMVLVLDTARYKYPSYWCSLDVLYESLHPIDSETGRPRGYFLISYDQDHPPVKLCQPDASSSTAADGAATSSPTSSPATARPPALVPPSTPLNWATVAHSFCKRIPENMWSEKPRTLEDAVKVVLRNVPPQFTRVLANQSLASSSQQENDQAKAKDYIRHLLADTTQSPLYPIVFRSLYPTADLGNEADQQAAFATLFILGSPRMLYTSLPRDLQDTLDGYRQSQFMTDVVQREVKRISREVLELTKSFCTCGPGWTSLDAGNCTSTD
ncbi:Phytochelatin-domain-containing protein [Hesseltinella vesiculosa]|uniref:glutathione gamma-glutamylcysteinyltransferase n=1 Tax=Hesseltinella vesiculosa TaxID=101127 RepID=A0A1X2GK64_9FUNG|nr:Phytochelatin-domain-containing protein [Hesseltinella vesiculosa]